MGSLGANPFGKGGDSNASRQYIDDMTSSSGEISGLSRNADCYPKVESLHLSDRVSGAYKSKESDKPTSLQAHLGLKNPLG